MNQPPGRWRLQPVGTDPVPQPASVLVRFASEVVAFGSYRDASEAWSRFRDASGLGASQMPPMPEIVDEQGRVIANISYNGRVWPGRAKDWHSDLQPLYDNRIAPVPDAGVPPMPSAGAPDRDLTVLARNGYFGNPNPHTSHSPEWTAHALGAFLHREGYRPPDHVRAGADATWCSNDVMFAVTVEADGIRFARVVPASQLDVDESDEPSGAPRP